MNPVRMKVERMGMPVAAVGMPGPVAPRPERRRGVVGMVGHREEGEERADREPRHRIVAVPVVVVSPTRLGGTDNREHGRNHKHEPSHDASSKVGNHRTPPSGGAARISIAHGPPTL